MPTVNLIWLAIAGTIVVLLGLYLFFWPSHYCKCSKEAGLPTTLLIMVHNQQEIIEGVVRSIANLYHHSNFETIIIDQHSTDQTLEILNLFQRGWKGFTLLKDDILDPNQIPAEFVQRYVRGRRLCCLQLNRPISSDIAIRAIEGLLHGEPEIDEEVAKVYYILRPESSSG